MEGTLCGSETDLRLIETLAWTGAALPRLDRHIARLSRSADRLGWHCDTGRVRTALRSVLDDEPARLRLTLDAMGRIDVVASPLPATASVWRLGIATTNLCSGDPWLGIKSTRRPVHDTARAALPAGHDEALLANERDEICEGTITNIFFDLGSGLMTPPASSGLLPGMLREEMLETGQCREAVLMRKDLSRARLWVGNSLRGLVPAILAAVPAS